MNPTQARERIRLYQQMTGRDLKDITAQGAKIAAEWLAEVTPPRGKGNASKQLGIGAINRDIWALFPTSPYGFLEKNHGKERAGRFWADYQAWRRRSKRKRSGTWGDIAASLAGTKAMPVDGIEAIRAAHKSARKNGKTYTNFRIYLAQNQKDVDKYRKELHKRVGYSKGGWAAAARQLGNSRLPAWMAGPGRGTVQSNAAGHSARAENLVAWAEYVTQPAQKSMADQIAQKRVMNMMAAAIKAIKAKTGV